LKILLTGSNGFLGRVLLNELRKQNLILTLNRANSDYNFDLEIDNFVLNNNFDLIIHNAGKAHLVPKNAQEINSFYTTNVKGTISLLESIENSPKPKYFVFISSVSVYGLNEGILINEDYPLGAKDPYGSSKIKCERIIQEWCNKNKVVCTILRLPLVVGSNPPGNLAAMIDSIKNGFYFNIGGGKAKKSMVLATDIAKHVLNAAMVGGIYNLTDGHNPSFNELSVQIGNQLSKRIIPNMPLFIARSLAFIGDKITKQFPFNSNRLLKITSTLTFDDLKARRAFGWNPNPVLNDFKIYD
jgi:nucleoside-diphosphate-sugar epimerase